MSGEFHMADLATLLDDDQPVMAGRPAMADQTPSGLVDRLIYARDRIRYMTHYAGGEDCPVRLSLDTMADAANHITAERKALNDLADLAEDERQRANRLMELLTQAREYIVDALDAYRHDDGLELLGKIDAEARGEQL